MEQSWPSSTEVKKMWWKVHICILFISVWAWLSYIEMLYLFANMDWFVKLRALIGDLGYLWSIWMVLFVTAFVHSWVWHIEWPDSLHSILCKCKLCQSVISLIQDTDSGLLFVVTRFRLCFTRGFWEFSMQFVLCDVDEQYCTCEIWGFFSLC